MLNEILSKYPVILEKSLMHTHCRGLHSIVFRDKPNMIRLYFAESTHELWKNEVYASMSSSKVYFPEDMSIAIHSHRQNITLSLVLGTMHNYIFGKDARKESREGNMLGSYRFTSPITGDKGDFTFGGATQLYMVSVYSLESAQHMHASVLHTIYVPRGQKAAWLIEEGERDPKYDNTCYSNQNLSYFSFKDLYKPMTGDMAHKILDECLK